MNYYIKYIKYKTKYHIDKIYNQYKEHIDLINELESIYDKYNPNFEEILNIYILENQN